jgi:hypothetical protein
VRDCDGKQRFDSYSFAARLARRSRRKGDTNRSVYHCRACNGFHIGSQLPGRVGRPREEEIA